MYLKFKRCDKQSLEYNTFKNNLEAMGQFPALGANTSAVYIGKFIAAYRNQAVSRGSRSWINTQHEGHFIAIPAVGRGVDPAAANCNRKN